MSGNEKVPLDPEPDFDKDPDAWRRWHEREADRYVASGQQTTFGYWRTHYEDLKHGPPSASRAPAVEEPKPGTSKIAQLKNRLNIFKRRKYIPIAERGDPKTNIFRLAAETQKRQESYPVGNRTKDLVAFGLLPQPALQSYLNLATLYLHMTHFKDREIVTQAGLNRAFENWATHFTIEPVTKTTLVFEDYIKPEDYAWLKQEARKDEASVLEWVARCRWATADFFKQ